MGTHFANHLDIQAQINDIINANTPGVHSPDVGAGVTADLRYSNGMVTAARRMAAIQIIDAIASNPNHSFWTEYATDVVVTHGSSIPSCYGQIGVPKIKRHATGEYETALPVSAAQIDSFRANVAGTFSSPLVGRDDAPAHDAEYPLGVPNPLSGKYSTENGVLKFTGYECKVPMVLAPQDGPRLIGVYSVATGSSSLTRVTGTYTFDSVTDVGSVVTLLNPSGQLVMEALIMSTTPTVAEMSVVAGLDSAVLSAYLKPQYSMTDQLADTKIPFSLAATNVRLAIGLLIKEGDSLAKIAGMYAGQGQVDLAQIRAGATAVGAIDVTRAVQIYQRRT